MEIKCKNNNIRISVLGASLETNNMGVSALAESSIKAILNRWPEAEITFLGSGYEPHQQIFSFEGREVRIQTVPIMFCKNIFLPYHFLWFVIYSLLVKVLPKCRLRDVVINHNQYFRLLYKADLAVDITGGDSFSDIYGFRRFFLGFLRQWLVKFFGKKSILLPQTYGPFEKKLTKMMARYILRKTDIIYSRDKSGVECVSGLLNNTNTSEKVRFTPDVAFILDSRIPADTNVGLLSEKRKKDSVVVGVNVSGLLYHGGYTRGNMFGLKEDYCRIIYKIIDLLMTKKDILVLLVPHVFADAGYVESDIAACSEIYNKFCTKYKARIFFAEGNYDQGQIKYVIGLCDFFIGSRMHSCIAALSQDIPAVGLAYSRKFDCVFESAGVKELVVDMREKKEDKILEVVRNAYENRRVIADSLRKTIPEVQKQILNMFSDL